MTKHFFQYIIIFLLILPIPSNANLMLTNDLPTDIHNKLQKALDKHREENSPIGHNMLLEELHEILSAEGYFSAQCLIENTAQNNLVRCNLGPATRIEKITIEVNGEDASILEAIIADEHKKPKAGDIFTVKSYENFKNMILANAREKGLLEADSQNSYVDILPEQKAMIHLRFNAGFVSKFGNIDFSNQIYDENFLIKIMNIEPGTPFSQQKLIQAKNQLEKTNLFKTIEIKALKENKRTIPLNIIYTPKTALNHEISFGNKLENNISSINNDFFITGTSKANHINRFGANLINELSVSSILAFFQASLILPINHPIEDFNQIKATFAKQYFPNSEGSYNIKTVTETLQASYNKKFKEHALFDIFLTVSANLIATEGELGNQMLPLRKFIHPGLSLLLQSKQGNGQIHAKTNITASVKPLSPTSFFKANGFIKWQKNINPTLDLILSTHVDYIWAENDSTPTTTLPLAWYYKNEFGNMRGFEQKDLMISPENNIQINKSLMIQTLQLHQEIKSSVYLTTSLQNAFIGEKFDNAAASASVGIMWKSPIGNLEAFVGKPLVNPLKHENSFVIGFNITHESML